MPPTITIPAKIFFQVTCKETNVGDTVWVVGSVPELGSWEVKEGLQLETTADSFPLWKSPQVPIIPGKIQFKIVILSENGNARWEGTKNKDVQTFESKRTQVQCAFNSDDMLCATMKMTEKDLEAAGVKLSKAQMDPAPEPAAPEPAPATPDTAVPPETEQGEGYPAEVPERTVPLKTEDGPPMQKSQSRHLFRLSDGSMQMDMTKTPSLMMMDLNSFMEEAEAEEKHVNELEERERLNQQQRRLASGALLQEMKNITDAADASDTVLLQGFNWESHQAGKGNWYGIVESKVEMFADMGITDIWLPPCSQSVAPQGYLPSQLFNLDASAYGKKDQLKQLLAAMRQKGIRGMADIVINHRCGDQQDEQGRWNVFTTTGIESRKSFAGVMDWQGWAITLGDKFSDGTGGRGPGQYDDKFDAAPDIDHGNKKVQQSIAIWMRWLRLDVGFDAWRFDFVKGYGAEYVGLYCKKSHPSWAVGELWLDMRSLPPGPRATEHGERADAEGGEWNGQNGPSSARGTRSPSLPPIEQELRCCNFAGHPVFCCRGAAASEHQAVRRHLVRLQRDAPDMQRLGFGNVVAGPPHAPVLIISWIRAGALASWNATAPEGMAVPVQSAIVSVNGVSGNAQKMREELRSQVTRSA